MSESRVFVAVGLDEVMDPDAFRILALNAELGLPSGNTEDAEGEGYWEI